jgi:hypothetical protein
MQTILLVERRGGIANVNTPRCDGGGLFLLLAMSFCRIRKTRERESGGRVGAEILYKVVVILLIHVLLLRLFAST